MTRYQAKGVRVCILGNPDGTAYLCAGLFRENTGFCNHDELERWASMEMSSRESAEALKDKLLTRDEEAWDRFAGPDYMGTYWSRGGTT